ncbi:MAG: TonB-dependent receptor [Acidobacteriota bacterium]
MKSLLTLLLALASVAFAQSDRGRLTGRITDVAGSVVPNATVKVEDTRTDATRETQTATDGLYVIDGLLSSTYKVTVTATGSAESVFQNVSVATGQERQLDVTLQLATVLQSIVVESGALAELETSSASIGANVTTREVANLPLNGRQLSQLYLLVPGASSSGSGQFNEMRFSGRANEQNTIRYDGIQAGSILGASPTDSSGGGATQMRLANSLENVQEFRVEASTYSAEYGRGTGGQITVITKSGSNQLHGGVFEYFRNDYMDARNAFDKQPKAAPLRLNQFGGSVGGAIVRDRAFFFVSQENLAQRVYAPFVQSTLSALARSQAVPAIRPLLAAYPVGNTGLISQDGLQEVVRGTLSSYVNDHFGSARFDFRLNDKNSLYVRYNRQQGESFSPSDLSGSGSEVKQTAQNAIIDLTTVITPTILNDLKIGHNNYKARNITQGVQLPGLDLSDIGISIGGGTGSGSTGFVTPRGAGSTPISHASPYTAYEWSFIDTLSWTHGAHSLKFGFEGNPRAIYMDQIGGISYTFTNVQSFLANTPSLVSVTSNVSDPSPFFQGATGIRKGVQYFLGGFVQDEWKIKRNLTMNIGMRYDYFSPLNEQNKHAVNVNSDTGALITQDYTFAASKLNLGPRLAFAWSPDKLKGKTVFRVGGGYYYGPGQGEDQWQPILNDLVAVTRSSGVAYPVDRRAVISTFDPNSPTAGYQPRVFATGYNIPEKVLSYTASIQQALPGQSVLTVAYVGSQGRNLFQRTIANRISSLGMNPSTGAVIVNREFGNRYAELDVKTTFGVNHYDSLQVGWNRRFSSGLNMSSQYTWSHNIGTSGGSNEASTSQSNYGFGGERGDNSFDIRHVFNFAALYELPVGKGRRFALKDNKAADFILGGWALGSNVNFRTGMPINVQMTRTDTLYYNPLTKQYVTSPVLSGGAPVTVPVLNIPGGGQSRGTQRPDLVPGVNPYVDPKSGFWLNPAAFAVPLPGTYGNLARNALRGPKFTQLDMTVSKQLRISERVKTELRGEVYNILNHPNWAAPAANLGSGGQPGTGFTRSTSAAFGQLAATVGRYVGNGTNRQIQVALRINF